jgi:hypothetical protein
MKYPKSELFEKLSAIEHERWADWQTYCHSKLKYSEYEKDGKTFACYIMDAGDYEHWQDQISRDYAELSEKEKDSDREQVMRYWDLIIK